MPSSSPFPRVTVLGLGVLGAQIALQTAAHGVDVTAYDVDDAALATGRGRLDTFAAEAAGEMPDAEAYRGAPERIRLVSDLAEAVREADLVIEAVPERLELKRDVWARVGAAAPEATVFATNSSSLLPSAIADATGRPDRFLALHFANHVWVNNTAEVMGTPQTDPAVADRVQAFAEAIGMIAIRLHKEQPGYVLNSLLIPFLGAAAELLVKGVADPATIDLTWRKATGAPAGPFQIYDVVGLRTAYAVASADPRSAVWAAHLKEHYLDQGKLGVESGEGFYRY
ncbi:3-hydroxyacyl-CoA dehydrogenase [Amnibacterium setariae]|uniref:3-hydroxyacyl-CoA dehydrogenase n=1 Tax=Amnibacterium setariae TaxID=2306585 RepID=A0A3A1U3D1_9MICO|nr:3-hydroxyacyl-CoA dehydrogenase [Amnibacterium setariae]RIX27524.1 3-hydroxyacyl-CoA dehydrogenase [Amnibacterium setariae]